MRNLKLTLCLLAALIGLSALGGAQAADAKLPETTPEGLKLVPGKKVSALYLREGASFSGYDKFAILDCYVAFKKDWKREQNSGVDRFKVSDSDMARIRTDLADTVKKVFIRELTAKGEKQVTAVGPGVLILRPAIINLDVTAPDTMKAGTRSFSANAGQATLFLEIYDSVTNELLARVYDVQQAGDSSFVGVRNGVTNRSDAEAVVTKWARMLATYLEGAREGAKPAASHTKP